MSGIFGKLTAFFATDTQSSEAVIDPVAVAVAALMVRLARADGSFDDMERANIQASLTARFGDGESILAAGEAAEAAALDHHQFTKVLKDTYAPEERGALLEELWSVVLADDARDMHEDALMRQFSALLYVPEREVAEARQRAMANKSNGD
ncbi:MAG: TerB family tellurite resistance protein [Pikeienuella sp.]